MTIVMNEEIAMTIKTTLIRLLAVTASAWAMSGAAYAEIMREPVGSLIERMQTMSPQERQRLQEEWRNLPPEQQAEKRREIHEHLSALSPEQRQQMRQQMREHWQQKPPEERREQRQRWQEERRQVRDEQQGQLGQGWQQRPQNGEGRGFNRRGRE